MLPFFLVITLALLVRLLYILFLENSPLSALSSMDTDFYISQANHILQGNWQGNEVFFQSGFLYPYFLALFRLFFGPSLLPVKIAQAILDSFSAALLLILAKRFFGNKAGVIAGIAYGLYGPFIAGSAQPLIDLPILFSLLAGLALYYRSQDTRRSALSLASGILLGTAFVTRPYLLLLVPVLFIAPPRQDRGERLFEKVKPSVLALLGVLFVLVPVAERNKVVGGEWVLTSAGGGWVFYIGNNSDASGVFYVPEGLGINNDPLKYARSTLVFPSRELGHPVKWSEASDFWLGRGLKFWKDEPKAALLITIKKVALLFNNYESGDNFDFGYFKRHIPWLGLPWPGFGFVMPFGIIGMVLQRRRFRELVLPYSILLIVALSQIIILVYSRHRYLAAVMLIFFGSSLVPVLKDWWQNGKLRNIFLSVLSLLALGAFAYMPVNIEDNSFWSALNLANSLWRSGKTDDAYKFYGEALKLNPNFQEGALDYAVALSSQGEVERAKQALAEMIDRVSSFRAGHQLLQNLYGDEPPADLTGEYGRMKKGEETLDDIERLAWGYFRERRFLDAKQTVQKALQRLPHSGRLIRLLAYAEDHLGNFSRAAELYGQACKGQAEQPKWAARREVARGFAALTVKNLKAAGNAFSRAIASDAYSAEAQYGLGVVLKKTGRFSEAEASYRNSIRLAKSGDRWIARAKEELEAIQNAGK